jgi:hypothetical protein
MDRRALLALGGAFAVGSLGRPLHAQTPATAAATSAMPNARDFGAKGDGKTDDTAALQAALDKCFGPGGVGFLLIPPGTYVVSRTLRIAPTADITRQTGIIGHGARLASHIADGSNILEINSRSTFRFLILEGLDILGSGKDGHGIYAECEHNEQYLYNICLRDIVVQGCGGDGLRMIGNVFESQLFNCYLRDNKGAGATFGHGFKSGILSAIRVMGCIFGQNGADGAALINKCYDVSFHGCYFLLNKENGLSAPNGCTLLSSCGFENNHEGAADYQHGGPGLKLQNFGTLVGCTAYSRFKQNNLIDAYVVGRLVMIGCTGSGDAQAKGAGLAVLRGPQSSRAVVIGCSGTVTAMDGFEPLELAGEEGGMRFAAQWNGGNHMRLGDYHVWVDDAGHMRMKRGAPRFDQDGMRVGGTI